MRKIIYVFGILFLAIILILNLLFTAFLDSSEHITITINKLGYFWGLMLSVMIIFFITKFINQYLENNSQRKLRKTLFIFAISSYMIFMIVWIIKIKPPIVGDQGHVCDLAQTFYSENEEEYLTKMSYAGVTINRYMEAYQQQIPLAFVYSIFFKIINSPIRELIKVINIICSILIVFALYKISNILNKKYKINKSRVLTLILTFISLPMLSTFVYGDIPSIALCLYNIFFMMKYIETKTNKYIIFASICTMLAYMMRMNSLIFLIASVIYLVLNFFEEFNKKLWKEKLINILIIVIYISASIIPSSLIKTYYLDKYNLDKSKTYPNISYFLMAMEEGERCNGWYNEKIAEYALKKGKAIEKEYLNEIRNRLDYFCQNPEYVIKFYIIKIASMWTENTYSAVNVNTIDSYEFLRDIVKPLTFYQKVLLIFMSICSLIILIKNRNNISMEVIFLLTVFVGGFAFHILWEAKSRYIIPYIIVLIPIASISIENISQNKKNGYLSS